MMLAPLIAKPSPQSVGNRRVSREVRPRAVEVDEGEADESEGLESTSETEGRLLPKLEVGGVGDPLEREADAIAARVMRMPAVESGPGGFPKLSPRAASVVELRRACCASCSTCDEDEEIRREPAAGQRGGTASVDFTSSVHQRLRLGGSPLSSHARDFLEPRLGVELGDVRTHADASAGSLARRVHARAFTLDQDIFFAPGELQPQTPGGMRLLAHEVAHTLQNRSSKPDALVRRSPASVGESSTSGPSTDARSLHARLVTPVRPREHAEERRAESFSRRPSLSALRTAPSRVERAAALPPELANQGAPLPDPLRRPLLAAGVDADAVRVHTDHAAARLAERFHARALTFQDHIAFASGEYRAQHSEGQALLLHETFHALRPASVFSLDRKVALQALLGGNLGQLEQEIQDLSVKDLKWLRQQICEKVEDLAQRDYFEQRIVHGLIDPQIIEEGGKNEDLAFNCAEHRRRTLRQDLLKALRQGQDITPYLDPLSGTEARVLLREVEKLERTDMVDRASKVLRKRLGMGERTSETLDLTTAKVSGDLIGILGPKSPELKRLENNLKAYKRKATAIAEKRAEQAEIEAGPAGKLMLELQAAENQVSMLGLRIKIVEVIQRLIEALFGWIVPSVGTMLDGELKSLQSDREVARARVKTVKRWLTKEMPPEDVMRMHASGEFGKLLDLRDYLDQTYEDAQLQRQDAIASRDKKKISEASNWLAEVAKKRRGVAKQIEDQYFKNYESYVKNARELVRDEAKLEELEADARTSIDQADYKARDVLSDQMESSREAHAEAQAKVDRLIAERDQASLEWFGGMWHRLVDDEKAKKKGKKGKKTRDLATIEKELAEAEAKRDAAAADVEFLDLVDESMVDGKPGEANYKSVVPGLCTDPPIELSTKTIMTARFQLGHHCRVTIHGHLVEREGSGFFLKAGGKHFVIVSNVEKNWLGLMYQGNGTRTGRDYLYMAAKILSPQFNTTHQKVVDAAASHLSSEGGLSSINTWDGQQLSIAGRSEKMGAVMGLVDGAQQLLNFFQPPLSESELGLAHSLLTEVGRLVRWIAGGGTVAHRFKVDEIVKLINLLETPLVMLMMSAAFINDTILRFYGIKTKGEKKDGGRTKLFMAVKEANEDVLHEGASPGVISVAIHNYLGSPANVPKPDDAVREAEAIFPSNNDGSGAYYAQISRQVAFMIRDREMATASKGKRVRRARDFWKWSQKARDFDSYYKYAENKTPFDDDAARDVIPGWGSTREKGHVPRLRDTPPTHGNYVELRNSDDSLKGYVDLGKVPGKREQGSAGDEQQADVDDLPEDDLPDIDDLLDVDED
jgi:hypothetical protein